MKIAISNASPLILLSKVGELDILFSIFEKIYISPLVYQETVIKGINKEETDAIDIKKHVDEKRIEIKQPKKKNAEYPEFLNTSSIHPGEKETIQLALDFKEDIILLDDEEARKMARAMKLRVKGTLGLLIKAFDLKLKTTEQAKSILQRLNKLMYLSSDLYEYVLKKLN